MDGSPARPSPARRTRRRFGLGLFAMQFGIILLVGVVAAGIAVIAQVEQVRRNAEDDLRTLARSVATLPVVIDGLQGDSPSEAIQPVTSALQESANVEYITVADMEGMRVAHPDPNLIGQPVSSDHAEVREGHEFSGSETGPMGLTLRAKVPVGAEDGTIIGTVSVGVAQSSVDREVMRRVAQVSIPTLLAMLLGGALAWGVTTRLRRRLYGVHPDEMLSFVQARQAMTNGVRDGIVGVDEHGRIAVINTEAQRLLDLPGTGVGDLAEAHLPPEVLAGAGAGHHDTRQVSTSGRTLIVSRSPAMAEGRVVGTVYVLQDRSELDALLLTLERERSRIDSLREEAHDFDNRMHVVSGLLGLGELEDAREYLASLPPAERPGGEREWSPIRSPLVAALLSSRQAQASARGIALVLTADSRVDEDFVCGPEEITVIGNLVSNAIEAARSRVDVFVRGDAEGLDLSVDDDGPGVPPERRESVFDSGCTTKTDESWRHGIGLDLVRRLARERAGSASAAASDTGGARFLVHLPPAADDVHASTTGGAG